MKLTTTLAALLALAACASAPPTPPTEGAPPGAMPTTPQGWRTAALTDLEALRTEIHDNTPIALDTENPATQRWYEEGYRQAHARAEHAESQAGYYYALLSYTNGFHDPHLGLSAKMHLAPASWPGFVTTARGDDVVVFYRDDNDTNAPPLGARVISCDGHTLDAYRTRNIYPFSLNPAFADDRRRSAARIFMDRHNPFGPAPRACVFESDGRQTNVTLNWRTLPDGDAANFYWDQYNTATLGPGTSFGITTPAPGVTWIGVPTFANESGDDLRALVDQIKAQAPAMRAGRAIVIDVRGNGGGNSDWGKQVADAIWGETVINALPGDNRPGAVDWRASTANRDYIVSFTPTLIQQFGADSDTAHWAQRAQAGISAAIEHNEPFWRDREPGDTRPIAASGGYTNERPTSGTPPIPAHVYVLSNGTCVSACLDFSDIVLHIPGVKLIGADTEGDGLLMEVRDATLPSGLVGVSLPLKVYRGRGRGALEAYHADVTYTGAWSDEAVRAWVMGLISAQ